MVARIIIENVATLVTRDLQKSKTFLLLVSSQSDDATALMIESSEDPFRYIPQESYQSAVSYKWYKTPLTTDYCQEKNFLSAWN